MMRRLVIGVAALLSLWTQPRAEAQESCLTVVSPRVTQRAVDGCRIQALVANACGRQVRVAIVRAVPHPQRGPLPTTTATIDRFQFTPLAFDRELCDQNLRILELGGDGSARDVTDLAITPPVPAAEIEARAATVNACVAGCRPPVTDRGAILSELRNRYRHALDDPEARGATDTLVNATVTERLQADRACAEVCQGRLRAADAPAAIRAAELQRTEATAAAVAALAAIAARPPRQAAPEPAPLPQVDESERRPPGQENRRASQSSSGAGRTVCRRGAGGRQRCTVVIDTRRGGQAQQSTRGRNRAARQQQERRGTAGARQAPRQGEQTRVRIGG